MRLSWSIVKEGKALERGSVSLEPGMKFVIGRNPTCDLVMLHESISRRVDHWEEPHLRPEHAGAAKLHACVLGMRLLHHACREHAAFVFDSFNCQAIVHDLESTHGTNVAGVWVKKGARKPLTAGTVVKLGASTREIHIAGVEIIR